MQYLESVTVCTFLFIKSCKVESEELCDIQYMFPAKKSIKFRDSGYISFYEVEVDNIFVFIYL